MRQTIKATEVRDSTNFGIKKKLKPGQERLHIPDMQALYNKLRPPKAAYLFQRAAREGPGEGDARRVSAA